VSARDITVDETGNWRLYWGAMPLPRGARALGVVRRETFDVGALLMTAAGLYVQGNAGVIRGLPQRQVIELVEPARAPRAWTLDDEPCVLQDVLDASGLSAIPEMVKSINSLQVGEWVKLGSTRKGYSGCVLKRVA